MTAVTQLPVSSVVHHCEECEATLVKTIQMIVEQRGPREVLHGLCNHPGKSAAEEQVAFFLLTSDTYKLAATGRLTPDSESLLHQIDIEELSAALLNEYAVRPIETGLAFESGWARLFSSGAGELFGIFVSLHHGPFTPAGPRAVEIDSSCRLAALAIEQKNLLDELAFRADHDPLTGLINRSCYERLLASYLLPHSLENSGLALLYLNLDRFRLVNDVMGHAIGDRLLGQAGRRLQSHLPGGAVLARVGGDEFVALLTQMEHARDAASAAADLLNSLKEPFSVEDHQLFLSASIGIGYSNPGSTPVSLEREANIAMYQAKQAGKGRAMLFHSSMATTPPERLEMEKRLRYALRDREMLLYYQPQIDLASGLVRGAEALLRWRQNDLGIVSPAAFIPILEETGLIVEFGRWVLQEACRQGSEWARKYGRSFRLGVNVSAIQFACPEFIHDVESALVESGFPPALLELELTESLFVGDLALAQRVFRKLQQIGLGLALDDFGTGQSSLSHLHHLPFERLKVDQLFIRPIQDGDDLPPIVENIIRLAQSLGMATIAEGIETAHQAELLAAARCDEGQGYFWATPLPADEFMDFCSRHGVAC